LNAGPHETQADRMIEPIPNPDLHLLRGTWVQARDVAGDMEARGAPLRRPVVRRRECPDRAYSKEQRGGDC
jgi:hypothetical protein